MATLAIEEHYELLEIDPEYKELKILEAQKCFWDFCLYLDYEFFTERKSVLKEIAQNMQKLIRPTNPKEEIDILNISLPPRSGKSYACTLFCTWVLGHYPGETIMRNTVTNRLYKKFAKDAIKIMKGESHRGRYRDIFPGIEFDTENIEDGWTLNSAKAGISYFGNGIGGAIVGFGATILSIVDDSVKGEEEALNEEALDKKWRWYGSEVDSREEKGCKKLFIGTRWSNKDIVGRLKKEGFFSRKNAKEIKVPALVNGQSYCEAIHTTKKLLDKKVLISDIIWEAVWQQSPIEAKGTLFKEEDLKRFKVNELKQKPEGIVMVGDIADEGDDSLCCPVGFIFGNKIFIYDVIFTTDEIEVTQPLVAGFIDKYKPDIAQFESNNGGKGFALKVKELIKNKKTTVGWKRTVTNKHTRIIMKSGYIKEYFYFRSQGDIEPGSDYDRYLAELKRYNKRGKTKHDDAPDATTMLAEITEKYTRRTNKGFFAAS